MVRLTIEKIEEIFDRNSDYRLDSDQKERIEKSYTFLKDFSKDKVIYGINTGFGPMAQYRISDDKLEELQYNLIHSHSNGTGAYLEEEYARIVMICRLNTLSLGFSGVSLQYLETLEQFIQHDIISCIPAHGGVGASGDLVQLAHVAYTLIGHGKVYYKGEIVETSEALKATGISPAKLKLRDGLGAINGTSCMSGIAAVNLIKAKKLIGWAIHASSIMNELTSSYDDSFSSELNAAKLHRGQQKVASIMRDLVKDGSVLKERNAHLFNQDHIKGQEYFSEKVQEYYSLRCVPQIIGPVLDTWEYCKQIVEDEVNSANDNPIICTDTQNVYHGGNFHGDYIALEMDKLKIAITKLSMLMERQINFLMNSKLNQIFPPFLNMEKLGFNFGLQGMQFTAVSTTAENQTLSNPMYVHSIPNNGDNQDIVSMGTNAAVMTQKVIDNSFEVLTILMISISQAIDLTNKIDQKAPSTRSFYNFVRTEVPTLTKDVALHTHQLELKKKLLNTEKDLF
ncbi:aromatic amino acid ammonia-lyase [Gilvimarinus agarilyticus]|uniref:HAL/PAL/TAL family ammonia-lyase n=1 Tax=Reichenbachiella agariperforans TaxID=156994 RepID=UPI001C0A2A26|nr:aromatic amino acid ammonia-lyase [Reichenbachiella agariperforans]MBU2884847.1 aromatic amino acid ammonia-lyase [Gilvimarinus agarilyticus]MBU2913017.1 aromatic amino acid ammonia-lyase [Reichenbachiella agariperforans]